MDNLSFDLELEEYDSLLDITTPMRFLGRQL